MDLQWCCEPLWKDNEVRFYHSEVQWLQGKAFLLIAMPKCVGTNADVGWIE